MKNDSNIIIRIVKENEDSIFSIFLSDYGLKLFPDEILSLTKLQKIDLSNNNISDIPKEIKNLYNLQSINLIKNKLKRIPKELFFLPNIEEIKLDENPLIEPPIEIANQGIAAIRNYYLQLESEESKVYEAKLLIVGEGYVGKTTLMHRLLFNNYNNDIKSTEGIEIKSLIFKPKGIDKFAINIWDFGGQEIYHATHQFFLTKRSLYLFVWDSIKEDKYSSFDYWLNIIKLLSDSSPVIVVQNKIDTRIKNVDETGLKNYFPNIINFLKVSAKENLGIKDLKELIQKEVLKLEHIGDTLPKVWVIIREILQSLEKPYIFLNEYLDICKKQDLNEEQSLFLSNYYHDLGVFLHFQDNPLLKEILFIVPEWATNAVYILTDTKSIIENHGNFNFKDLIIYWKDYKREEQIYLIELMKKFELCFQLHNSNNFVIPELLPESLDQFDWDFKENLKFEYQYTFMPKAIITRFIVLNHHLILNNQFSRNGVIISFENSKAFIQYDYLNKRIKIYIKGNSKVEILSIIRKDIDYIHNTLNRPEVKKMIGCICKECYNAQDPYFFDFITLRKFQEKKKNKITCFKSAEDVSINTLLGYQLHVDDVKYQDTVYAIEKIIEELSLEKSEKLEVKKEVNKYVMLQPNFCGMGININKIIDDLFNKRKTKSTIKSE